MMKIVFLNGINSQLDASRGIGAHTNTLLSEFLKIGKEKLEIVEDPKKADICHITKFNPFFISLPFVKLSKRVVLTIHDLIPLIYPKNYPPGIKGKINFVINKFLIRKEVDAIITISETSKKDICRFLNIDPKKVFVIYLAPKKEYKKVLDKTFLNTIKNKFNLPTEFVFYFGDINYNKNLPTLVEACKSLDITLVIGGKQAKEIEGMDISDPETLHLKSIYKDIINEKRVLRLGYLSDEDANAVYNLASVCVQPSFYEGFGFSVIHAFAAGCPVIAAKTQVLVEIGDGACLFVNPNDSVGMAEKISQVLKDKELRNNLIESGRELVKHFSWKRTAEETLEVYKNV